MKDLNRFEGHSEGFELEGDRFMGPKLKHVDISLEIHTNGIKFMDLQLKMKDIHSFLEHLQAIMKDIQAILKAIMFNLVLFPFICGHIVGIFSVIQSILEVFV